MSCIQTLKERGHRITSQRTTISLIIPEAERHLTVEDIFKRVKEKNPKVDCFTIFRNLNLMQESGLVTKTDVGDGIYRYHPADRGHHHHLICRNCERVLDLEEEALEPLKDILIRQYNLNP